MGNTKTRWGGVLWGTLLYNTAGSLDHAEYNDKSAIRINNHAQILFVKSYDLKFHSNFRSFSDIETP